MLCRRISPEISIASNIDGLRSGMRPHGLNEKYRRWTVGASFWHQLAHYEPDPGAAIVSCQIDFYRRSGFDLARYLDARIKDMHQAVAHRSMRLTWG
jgi:hypothetical protein